MNTKKIALPFVVVIAMLLAFSSPAAAAVGIGGYAGDKPLVTYETDVIRGGIVFVTDETNSTYTTLNTTYYRGDLGYGQPSEFWNNLAQTIEITGIPDGATIKTARLYNYYTWSTSDWDNTSVPGVPAEADIWFTDSNDVTQKKECIHGYLDNQIGSVPNPIYYGTDAVQYWNTKGQNYSSKSYDYPSGTFAWDVTSMVTGNGIYTAKITNNDSSPSGIRPQSEPINPSYRERFATYGFGLLVVYEDSTSPKIQYWIDEGRDILYNKYGETSETATTIAQFNGNAKWLQIQESKLTTVCTASDEWWKDPAENAVSFNNIEKGQSTAKDTYSIAVDEFDVTQELIQRDNFADFQSRGDYFGVCNAWLVVEKVQP